MAWTTPKTWASGYVVLAADLNTHLRDNLNVTAPAVLTTAGDILYASGANTPARLAKSTTSTQYLANTGASNIPAWNEVALDTGVSGTLPVGNGGTGATTFTANGILVGNSTSAVAVTATMATKGHLMAGDGSGVPSMLAVGGTGGYILTVDSGEATGMKWALNAGGTPELQDTTQNMIEGSTAKLLYFMEPADKRTMNDAGNGASTNKIGLGLIAHESGGGNITGDTTIRGGWKFTTDNTNGAICGLIGDNGLDPTQDWTLVCRGVWPSASSQEFAFGLSGDGNLHDGDENDFIGFRVDATGNFIAVCDSGGTETTDDSGVAVGSTERTLRIAIRSGASTIEFFVDNASIGSITSNIPTGQGFAFFAAVKTGTTATKTFSIANMAGWAEQ